MVLGSHHQAKHDFIVDKGPESAYSGIIAGRMNAIGQQNNEIERAGSIQNEVPVYPRCPTPVLEKY